MRLKQLAKSDPLAMMSTITYTWQNTVMIAYMCTRDCSHCSCVWCAATFLNELKTRSFAYTKHTVRHRNPHKMHVAHAHTHTHTHTTHNTHTHTCTCTCTCIYHSQNWLRTWAPLKGVSQQEVTRLVDPIGSGDTSLISTSAWPPQCIGVLIYGLVRPMR